METIYAEATQKAMLLYYGRLGEKERRQYAALEAMKLGHGGVTYISKLLSIDRSTIIAGKKELQAMSKQEELIAEGRQRRAGGGRKKKDRAA